MEKVREKGQVCILDVDVQGQSFVSRWKWRNTLEQGCGITRGLSPLLRYFWESPPLCGGLVFGGGGISHSPALQPLNCPCAFLLFHVCIWLHRSFDGVSDSILRCAHSCMSVLRNMCAVFEEQSKSRRSTGTSTTCRLAHSPSHKAAHL